MPLILTSNEIKVQNIYDWKDIIGVQYHYPNVYVNKVKPGETFIYYRGVRRAENKRGTPEYFGYGIIGDVWRDEEISSSESKSKQLWYCAIEQYTPFVMPVPFKIEGLPFEDIAPNLWGVGIRRIDEQTYQRILQTAGIAPQIPGKTIMPDLVNVHPQEGVCLLPKKSNYEYTGDGSRYSKRAKLIGDRAEALVLEWLRENVTHQSLRWVAQDGHTPGWDIEYLDEYGRLTAVEVKASAGKAMLGFEVTKNELDAAQRLGEQYWFYLVTDCLGSKPLIQKFSATELEKQLRLKPIRWSVELS